MAGHNCRVFERYAIVNRSDMADAILKLEQSEKQIRDGHEMVTLPVSTRSAAATSAAAQARLIAIASVN